MTYLWRGYVQSGYIVVSSGDVNAAVYSGAVSLLNSGVKVDANNPLPVTVGSSSITIGSGSFNISFASGTFALLSGNTSIYTASGTISNNNPFPIGGMVGVNSGEVHVMSGQINAVVNSGNINAYISSGNITAAISSGNINAYVNSGNVRIMSGNITLLNSGANVGPTNPLPVTIASGSIGGNGIPVAIDPTITDAFGRIRVSNPYTIFDSQQRYQINDRWNYATTTGGSTSFDVNSSLVNLKTSLASGAEVICETKKVMAYQPGKSLFILQSFCMSAAQDNLRQRTGYFGAQNGVYFEQDGTTQYFVLRSYISGVVVNNRVDKTLWNYDKLDGQGPSGISITNFNSSLLMWADIEWLGVGDVKVGFVLNGKYVICHVFKNTPAGSTPISGTYMTTACLPLRYEITNTGPIVASGNLKQICSTVIIEGGVQSFQRSYNAGTRTNEVTLQNANTLYPLVSIRLASGRMDSVVIPSGFDAIVTSNQNVMYRLVFNGTLNSGTSWVTHTNGNVQYDTSSTHLISGSGVDIVGGYIVNAGSVSNISINQFEYQLGRTIGGVSDIITLAIAPTSPNTKVLADLGWYEII